MPRSSFTPLLCCAALLTCGTASAADWPQFRGPNATGLASDDVRLPADIGPDRHLLWKVPVAKGHSSPVIVGDRLYLTALREKRLLTLAFDAATGERLWEAEAPYEKLESVHRIGSPATPSVAADGDVVVSFFGSCGLFAYDRDGKQLWHDAMGPFDNQFGATSSPLLHGERIVLIEDHDNGSFLATYDKRTGKELWRVERPNFRRSYGSPVIWTVDGRPQVVVSGSAHLTAYDLETGELVWLVRGVCRVVSSTPVVGPDGRLYFAATGGGAAAEQPAYSELLKTADANGNELLEPQELPNSPIKGFFGQFDRDRSGALDRDEYESIREIFELSRSVALAIEPGGTGDITETHVAWEHGKSIPRNSSPVLANGHLFLVADGGILTSLDAKTGAIVKQGRLAGRGKYFSSPIVGDGKLFVVSERGALNVVTAAGDWKQLHAADFGEDCYATPAIAHGRLYVRTVGTLFCFGRANRE